MAEQKFGFGWRPDKPDQRDLSYATPRRAGALPDKVDLRICCPPVFDQSALGSCTANAISAALQYSAIKDNQADKNIVRSRLFIYYNERSMEGTISSDAGAEIRDGIKSVAKQGACNETLWWYNIAKFTVKPNQKCYQNALKYKSLTYMRVNQDLTSIKSCLAEGFPIVLGISVYNSFMTDAVAGNGIIPMPTANESLEGGHAVLIVGYDDTSGLFTFRNSWGTGWGAAGYGYIPYNYLTNNNLCDDLWTIRTSL